LPDALDDQAELRVGFHQMPTRDAVVGSHA
jgi:hypothetical protein